jgi:hypothetical protein
LCGDTVDLTIRKLVFINAELIKYLRKILGNEVMNLWICLEIIIMDKCSNFNNFVNIDGVIHVIIDC